MNRAFAVIERLLLGACVLLLVFFYIYVYGLGRVRGPLAREEFYRRGEVGEEAIAVEKAILGEGEEELKSPAESADTTP